MCSMMAMALSYRSNPTGVKSGNFATFALSPRSERKSALAPTRQLRLPMLEAIGQSLVLF
ncbi:hypothetical protein ACVWWU_002142 [Pantoea sp. PA1]